MLNRMLAFSSNKFCWLTGTPVRESYLFKRNAMCCENTDYLAS